MTNNRLLTSITLGVCTTLGAAAISPVALAQPAGDPTASAPDAKEVFADYIEAIGGTEALEKHESRHFSGNMVITTEDGNEIKAILNVIYAAPNKFRQEILAPGVFEQVLICDGENAWQGDNGAFRTLSGPQLRSVLDTGDFNAYYGIGYEDRYDSYEETQWTQLRGETLAAVRGVRPSGAIDMLFFDPNTSLLRAFRSIPAQQQSGIAVAEYWIDEYTEHEGVQVPTKLTVYGTGFNYELTYKRIKFNDSVQGEFDKPAGVTE